MITIIYSTHKSVIYNDEFKTNLIKSVGLPNVQILEYVNHNQYSLSEIYNKGIDSSEFDVVVCIHNDVKLEKGWGQKLIKDFQDNPDYGIIGKAGSCFFPQSGIYWENMVKTMVGQVYHHPHNQKKWINKYSPRLPFLVPVVTIDGLFISFDKTKIKHKFDETIGKFHFYDHLFCLPNYLEGVKIGVTSSFEITHESVGIPNKEFFETKEKFVKKFETKLPLNLLPEKPYVPTFKVKQIKNMGKVAVIIPTKGKLEILFNCVNSFFEHCDEMYFDIFIADTGSSEEEKKSIKEYISKKNNIKLIEYDFYNFAKINNHVVDNYINDTYEFILFCNNDIVLKNNVIHGMLNTFKTTPKVGTVGVRLHYEDNTVQHDGILLYSERNEFPKVSHQNLKSYYNYSIDTKVVVGNTAALMMIKKKVFEQCGKFNEQYEGCFEDVELNFECVKRGYKNYCNGSLVAYHLESQTRNEEEIKNVKEYRDYHLRLKPYIEKNMKYLSNYIMVTK